MRKWQVNHLIHFNSSFDNEVVSTGIAAVQIIMNFGKITLISFSKLFLLNVEILFPSSKYACLIVSGMNDEMLTPCPSPPFKIIVT